MSEEQQAPTPRRVRSDQTLEISGFQKGIDIEMKLALVRAEIDSEAMTFELIEPPQTRISKIVDVLVNPPCVPRVGGGIVLLTATSADGSSINLRATGPFQKQTVTLHVYGV